MDMGSAAFSSGLRSFRTVVKGTSVFSLVLALSAGFMMVPINISSKFLEKKITIEKKSEKTRTRKRQASGEAQKREWEQENPA